MDQKVVSFANERLNIQTERLVGTKLGNSNINITTPSSDAGTGTITANTRLTWNISGLGGSTLLESDVNLLATLTVAYTRATFDTDYATAVAAARNEVGLHSCPLNRLIPHSDVTINGEQRFSSAPAEEVDFFIHSMNESELRKVSDISRPDNALGYDRTTLSDVLRCQADSHVSSRGLGCTSVTSVAWDTTTVTVVWELRERLLASPFQGHTSSPKSFMGIDNMQVACLIGGNIALSTSAAGSPGGTAVTIVSTLSNVRLELRQSTPHVGYNIPQFAEWMTPNFEFTDSSAITNPAAGDTGEVGSITSSSVVTRHFSTVPKLFCIYAYEVRPDVNSPFRFFPISNLSLRVGGSANIFNSYTKNELYEMNKRYGLNSLPSCLSGFYGGTGTTTSDLGNGFMVFFSPYDFDTPELFQSNATRSFDVTIESITLQNYDIANHTVRVRLMAVSDKKMEYSNGKWSSNPIGLSDAELVQANASHQYVDVDYSAENLLGASLWTWVRDKLIKPVVRYGREHNVLSSIASKVDPRLGKVVKWGESAVSPYLAKQGYGKRGGHIIESGGKKMSQAELIKALRD